MMVLQKWHVQTIKKKKRFVILKEKFHGVLVSDMLQRIF